MDDLDMDFDYENEPIKTGIDAVTVAGLSMSALYVVAKIVFQFIFKKPKQEPASDLVQQPIMPQLAQQQYYSPQPPFAPQSQGQQVPLALPVQNPAQVLANKPQNTV